jgi:hypothetical protein
MWAGGPLTPLYCTVLYCTVLAGWLARVRVVLLNTSGNKQRACITEHNLLSTSFGLIIIIIITANTISNDDNNVSTTERLN